MKFVVCSDTHEQHRAITPKLRKIREEKGKFTLLHAGDLTFRGEPSVFEDYNAWIGELQEDDVIDECLTIPGNHDLTTQPGVYNFTQKAWRDAAGRNYERVMKSVTNYHLLIDQSVTIDGIKFFGTPKTPAFGGGWAHQLYSEEDKKRCYDLVPHDVDIWIGHGPPYDINDKVQRGNFGDEILWENAGCKTLLRYIEEIKPKFYVCGHLHDPKNHIPIKLECGTTVINAAICDENYKPIQDPIYFEINK